MAVKKSNLIISDEWLVYRFNNGIKLIRPEEADQYKHSPVIKNTGYNVAQLFDLPLSFYFLNPDGVTQKISQEGARICGFESSKDAIGKSLSAVAEKNSANRLINNCKEVMQENTLKLYDEENVRKDRDLPIASL